jgi:hypothetical protein
MFLIGCTFPVITDAGGGTFIRYFHVAVMGPFGFMNRDKICIGKTICKFIPHSSASLYVSVARL